MVVATKLLARRKFVDTGKQFNMIAASWIQFMIHDWIDHLEETNQVCLYIYICNIRSTFCPDNLFSFEQWYGHVLVYTNVYGAVPVQIRHRNACAYRTAPETTLSRSVLSEHLCPKRVLVPSFFHFMF